MLLTGNNSADTITNSADTLTDIKDLQEQITQEPNIIMEYFKGWLPHIANFAINILISIVIYFIGKKIIEFILKLVERSCSRIGAEESASKFISSVIKILMYLILIIIIGNIFGLNGSTAAALLGSAGLAIGLAFQGSLSNVAGGILLLILKPFKIGDYIIEQSTGNEGTVTNIDIFYTKLLTVDNKMVAMPNGNVINSSITNVTNEDFRRLDIKVGINYKSDLKKAKEIMETILLNDPARVDDKELDVFVSELGPSAVILGGRMWVKTEEYLQAKWRVVEEIKITFDENEIDIPFNQLDIHIKEQHVKQVPANTSK
jgi:small conductance mechanosensitive channel